MRQITAYMRLLSGLEILEEALARSYAHVSDQADLETLHRVQRAREALARLPVEDPDSTVDDALEEQISILLEAALRARFYTESESSVDRFREAANEAEGLVGGLYVSGSESWEKFPP